MTIAESVAAKVTEKLPAGWQLIQLKEVISETQPGFACGERDDTGVIQLRMNNVTTDGSMIWDDYIRVPVDSDKIEKYLLKHGDVLFNNTNSVELVGKSALFRGHGERVVYSNHFTRLRPNVLRLDSEYLSCWLILLWQSKVFENLCNRWIGQSAVKSDKLLALQIPLPQLKEQQRIVALLRNHLTCVHHARVAAEAQLEAAKVLPVAFVRKSLNGGKLNRYSLSDCLLEVKEGVGEEWAKYPVLGATRGGLAPAKEPVGKKPERYKLANHETVFYNPMRILLGSIAMVDRSDEPGITSPDYVVVKGKPGILDTRWFYYFFRSSMGEHLIKTLVRGAVRERILFKRLVKGEIELPSWETQRKMSELMFKARDLLKPIEDRIRELNLLPSKYLKLAFNGEL